MLLQFQNYLTFENIYLWTNFGIFPFWLMLLLIPNSKFTQFLVNSVLLPLILASAYIYLIYLSFLSDETLLSLFSLYLSLENLYTIFATESFLLIFWLHFISLNLFMGLWMARDGVKYNIPRKLVFFPLIFVYLSGPVGLVLYWFIRVFYAKKLGLHD